MLWIKSAGLPGECEAFFTRPKTGDFSLWDRTIPE